LRLDVSVRDAAFLHFNESLSKLKKYEKELFVRPFTLVLFDAHLDKLHEVAVAKLHDKNKVFLFILDAGVDIMDAQDSGTIGFQQGLHDDDFPHSSFELDILLVLLLVVDEL
jgi:hypothetical protein